MDFVEYTIGELALEIKTGKTPPTSNSEYFDGEIPWIGPSDLKGQKITEDSQRRISEIALEDRKAFLYKPGTVLISTIGDIGKTTIVKKPVASNQQLTGILVNEDIILPELFYYWIRLNKRILENKANTAVLSMLNNKLLKRVKVVFPKDFEDQYKIVGRLNRIQELIDIRVESIQLLNKYIRSVFLEMFGDPVINERGYPEFTLNELIEINIDYRGKTPPKSNSGIPLISSANIKNGKVDFTVKQYISESNYRDWLTRGEVEENDVLVTTEAPAGEVALYPKGKFLISRRIIALRPNSTLNSTFLYYIMRDENWRKRFRGKKIGATVERVRKPHLFNQNIIRPNILDQNRFEIIHLKFQNLKSNYKQSIDSLKTLFQVVLQNAFSKESQIKEEEVFESILQTFTKEDLKQGDRLKHLLKWIDYAEPRFSDFESYDLAWDRLRELLEDGSIEQVLDKNEIKLKVVE